MFKKMFQQKRKEQIKEFEKQEKKIKELKSQGQSKKAAVNYNRKFKSKFKINFFGYFWVFRKRNKKMFLHVSKKRIVVKCKKLMMMKIKLNYYRNQKNMLLNFDFQILLHFNHQFLDYIVRFLLFYS